MKTDLEYLFEIPSGEGATEQLLRHNRVLCYKTRTIRCGEAVEVEAFPVYRRGYPDRERSRERLATAPAQARLNDKRAENHFRRKAECNFGRGDYFLTLTYKGEAPTMERAARDFRNFIARVNRRRRKKGLSDVRYMGVLEAGNRSGRAHHHVLIDGELSREEYEELWGKGFANCDRLQVSGDGLKAVCKYMLKASGTEQRQKHQKRWTCSRNLREPRITESLHRVTKRQAGRIAADAKLMGEEIMKKLYPGKTLTELTVRRSDFIAGAYIYARLVTPCPT